MPADTHLQIIREFLEEDKGGWLVWLIRDTRHVWLDDLLKFVRRHGELGPIIAEGVA